MDKISEEQKRLIYEAIEECQQFFHQPLNFENQHQVDAFAARIYPKLHHLYYNVIAEWNHEQE